MRKFVCSTILVFAVALICAACGTADKKEKSDAVSKSEEAKTEEAKTEEEQIPQWVKDGGESATSDEEICAVGEMQTTKGMINQAMSQAVSEAQFLLCKKVAIGNECNLPKSKMKKMSQSRVDDYGRVTLYVLVCIDRKDLEENKKEESEEKTDEDKVVQ